MLTAQQRSTLRSKYNKIPCTINIGKQGISENLIAEINTWLFCKEIVKIGVLRSFEGSIEDAVTLVCKSIDCDCVQKVGGKAILYRKSDKEGIEHIL